MMVRFEILIGHGFAIAALVVLAACSKPASAPELSEIAGTSISVSGIGAGAFMATQYHLANSASVNGLVSIGGGPYACAQGSEERAFTQCMHGPSFDLMKLRHVGRDAAAVGEIDTLNHLADDRIFVASSASGLPDARVSYAVLRFYEELIDTGELIFSDAVQAGDIDSLIAGLEFLNAKDPRNATPEANGRIRIVRFAADRLSKLPGTARVYEPSACVEGACSVHVHFGACNISEPFDQRFRSLHELADRLSLRVAYPDPSDKDAPFACWDWWGANSSNYASKNAPQLVAITRLIEALKQ